MLNKKSVSAKVVLSYPTWEIRGWLNAESNARLNLIAPQYRWSAVPLQLPRTQYYNPNIIALPGPGVAPSPR